MRYFAALLLSFLVADTAMSVELFRYRGAAKGRRNAGVRFDTDEQDVPLTVTKEKVAEIAADFMGTFYHMQVGVLA